MASDVDSIKSITGHIMTLQREWFYGNQGYKNMLHYPVQKLNTLLLLKGV
jgi:hypothetical protein